MRMRPSVSPPDAREQQYACRSGVLLGGSSMSDQHSFVPADRFDRDQFTNSQAGEHALNAAIVHAEISRSFEEYLEIFDAFYADDIEVSTDTEAKPICAKAEVRSAL